MLIKGKAIAIGGLFTAIAAISLILSDNFRFNGIFLIVLSSFLIGTVTMATNLIYGILAGVITFVLGFIFCPVKLYSMVYSVCAAYFITVEFLIKRTQGGKSINRILKWTIKIGSYALYSVIASSIVYFLFDFTALIPEDYYVMTLPIKIIASLVFPLSFMLLIDNAYFVYRRLIEKLMNIIK